MLWSAGQYVVLCGLVSWSVCHVVWSGQLVSMSCCVVWSAGQYVMLCSLVSWSVCRVVWSGQLVSMSNYIEREVIRRAFVVERWNFREKEKLEHEAEAKKRTAVSVSFYLTH